jgi:hypothetical protein
VQPSYSAAPLRTTDGTTFFAQGGLQSSGGCACVSYFESFRDFPPRSTRSGWGTLAGPADLSGLLRLQLTQLDGTYGAVAGINQIRITMHKGAASPLLGRTAGPCAFQYQIPDGYRFAGLFGCVGPSLINSMGINIQN